MMVFYWTKEEKSYLGLKGWYCVKIKLLDQKRRARRTGGVEWCESSNVQTSPINHHFHFYRCHRSSRSSAYKVYEQVKSTVPYLPCIGASVDNGILVSVNGTSQIGMLEQIAQIRGSGPDLLMISVGGNDIGYLEMLSTLIRGTTNSLFSSIDMRFFYTFHGSRRKCYPKITN